MLPISEEYLHSPCEIYAKDNTPLLIGYLSQFCDDGIQISPREGHLPVIHNHTTVKINIMNDTLGFKVLVGLVYLSTEQMIRVINLQNIMDYEKRNFFRVKVNLEAKAFPVLKTESSLSAAKTDPMKKTKRIHIHDISLSGLYFLCGCKLEIGDHLIVKLNLYHTSIALLGKIVREVPTDLESNYGYGCEFLDNSGKQFDVLCKYLFDCQREQIQIMKQRLSEI